VAGLRQQEGGVGWKKVLIAPNPGPLDSAAAAFESPAGNLSVRWSRTGNKFTMMVGIAPGIEAEALLPDGTRRSLRSGTSTLTATVR
jgi:alpha-L-rhamnosidase